MHLVVASRIKLNSEARTVKLEPLPEESAQQLLIEHSEKADIAWQPGQAAQLAASCCHNALLLKIIGAMLAADRCSIEVRQLHAATCCALQSGRTMAVLRAFLTASVLSVRHFRPLLKAC